MQRQSYDINSSTCYITMIIEQRDEIYKQFHLNDKLILNINYLSNMIKDVNVFLVNIPQPIALV